MVPWLAGALLGAGAALRDEVILLAPGLLLAVWFRALDGGARDGGRRTRCPAALAAVVDVWWFDRPAVAPAACGAPASDRAHLTN